MENLLETINSPKDLRGLSVEQLEHLADEMRDFVTHSVSQTGGHLASNLGIIELTIAMHRVFDFQKDRLLWDVGHQCYAHKILTGRKDRFCQLRQEGGLSGFPSPDESDCDVFSVGHAGTSIATALGMALGAQHNQTDEKIVALVGDASIVNGLSFEALNNTGLVKRQMLIVLNDNSMAIDVTQGAMAGFLSRVRLSHTYEDIRKTTNRILEHLPLVGKPMEEAIENVKKTLRMANTPSRLFESMNIPYFGPVDGHDIGSLIELFGALSHLDRPAILHVYTRKGKGYSPADDDPRKYHSTGPFEVNGDTGSPDREQRSFTAAFGDAVAELGQRDSRIAAITAAMSDGTGLAKFRQQFPQRYYDVGIAESVAVDIAAGLARQGLRPVVCIYSTFLQRGFDQIFQEASLQNLPVTFCIDRAGAVGSDGPTHHGFLDIGFLRMLPNLTVAAPADERELKAALYAAAAGSGPFAIRYPRDTVPVIPENTDAYAVGKSAVVRRGDSEFVLVTLGPLLKEALDAAEQLQKQGIRVTVVNARFAKPIDAALAEWFAQGKTVILAEDGCITGGFGSAVLERMLQIAAERNNPALRQTIGKAVLLGAPDSFVPAANRGRQLEWMGLTAQKLAQIVLELHSPTNPVQILK
ncbi:MAG: 1-deoxy-D-xylulose-5-phosphate synthase [Planctomycetales bacterium]|nr:1-deoxy-D-xylulose-5-phosphate synthase [Planctomycetales bacterium]